MTKIWRRFVGIIFRRWVRVKLPDTLWARIADLVFYRVRPSSSLSFERSSGFFLVQQSGLSVRFARRTRLRPMRSMGELISRNAASYGLDQIGDEELSVAIDVGANIGMIALGLEARGVRLHCFEPDPMEYECLRQNLGQDASTYQVAVAASSGEAPLWLRNESGDSSLLKPTGAPSELAPNISVETISLDDWAKRYLPDGEDISLLKLEAEGAEPEVLLGARNLLDRVRYVAADVSPERSSPEGFKSTRGDIEHILSAHGFQVIWTDSNGDHVLFRNNRIGQA